MTLVTMWKIPNVHIDEDAADFTAVTIIDV